MKLIENRAVYVMEQRGGLSLEQENERNEEEERSSDKKREKKKMRKMSGTN